MTGLTQLIYAIELDCIEDWNAYFSDSVALKCQLQTCIILAISKH